MTERDCTATGAHAKFWAAAAAVKLGALGNSAAEVT